MIDTCVLTGEDLAVEDVWRVAVERAPIALGDEARGKIRAARELVERAAFGLEEHTYGVNTGFGRFHTVSIPAAHTEELQVRLLRSHAAGVGEPYPDEIVRAAMLLRANALGRRTFRRAGRDGRAARRVPEPRRRARSSRAVGRWERAVTSPRSHTWHCP